MLNEDKTQKIHREHEEGIEFAERMLAMIGANDAEAESAFMQIKAYCDLELEQHLQHEEMTLFAPLFRNYKAHQELARQLLQEHGRMRSFARLFDANTPVEEVNEFLELLKAHSITEEEQLLPAISELFSEEEMKAIGDFTPLAKQ